MKTRTIIFLTVLALPFLIPQTATAGISVAGGLSRKKQAEIGETYQGIISLKNTSDGPQEVKVYQTDYTFFCNGKRFYSEPGKIPRSNANWISFNPHRMIIPPGGTTTVNYTIKVPDDPNLVGTYWSMIMVEGIPESSPESSQTEDGKTKVGITQVMRYAIQMLTHIGDTGERKLKFLETKLLRETEKRLLQVDMENIGERYLAPSLWAELYDEHGGYTGKFEACVMGLYPGTSVRYKVDLSDVPEGNYKAMVVADCGGDYIFGANYTLKVENEKKPSDN